MSNHGTEYFINHDDQVLVLKKCFDGFADEEGAIPADNVGSILSMMGMKVKPAALREIIEDIDKDKSGLLEFGEFCILASKFLIEEDEESLKKELKVLDNFCFNVVITMFRKHSGSMIKRGRVVFQLMR